jgi:hypothetical protein
MTTFDRLSREARAAARWRGHDLTHFRPIDTHHWRAQCRNCPADVDVNLHPLPNEIDISGEAVALNCPVDRRPQ